VKQKKNRILSDIEAKKHLLAEMEASEEFKAEDLEWRSRTGATLRSAAPWTQGEH